MGGGYHGAGEYGYWWTSGERGGSAAYVRVMDNVHTYMYEDFDSKAGGFSVRCVRD